MFVKVCGIKRKKEIEWAINLGYSAIGIVVFEKSKRFCNKDKAIELIEFAKHKIKTVVVSLFFKDILPFLKFIDLFQIYEIPPEGYNNKLLYSFSKQPQNIKCKYLIYDASTGSGEFKKFPAWLKKYRKNLIIAGGLNHNNVKMVIEDIMPFGVDVSSGVEANGDKDYHLMEKFIKAVKGG